MTRQPFHMQQIWMPWLVIWQEFMLASISPIAAPENLPVHANFNAIISSIPCNAAIVPAPDNPWMTSKSLAMSLWNAAVKFITVTALSRTGEPWSWVLDLSTFGCNIKVYQHNTNISVSTDNTNWFILKWHSNSKLCDYHICLLMRSRRLIFKSWHHVTSWASSPHTVSTAWFPARELLKCVIWYLSVSVDIPSDLILVVKKRPENIQVSHYTF